MALNKDGMDLKAIRKDQKAIDALPNRGRVQSPKEAQTKAIMAKMGEKKQSVIERSNRQVAERNAGKTKEQISEEAFKSGRTSGRY
jgi:hypothetical protein